MAHPHQSKREDKVSRARARELTKGYANGGAVHSDEGSDKSLIKKMVKPTALKMSGGKPKSRMDRPGRAAGGAVKRPPQTNIHINVTPPSSSPTGVPAVPPMPPAAKPAPPPIPPGAANAMLPGLVPGMGPPGGPGGGPPMMRAKGGRVGKGFLDAEKNKTPVQHLDNISKKGLGRGKPVTYAKGGAVKKRASGGEAGGDRGALREPVRGRTERASGTGMSSDRDSGMNEKEASKHRSMPPRSFTAEEMGMLRQIGPPLRKRGGPINAPVKGGMGPHMPGGGRGGLGRLAKARRAKG